MTWMWMTMAVLAVPGAVWLFVDYLKNRVRGFEDRYMALYGKEDWEGSGMEFSVEFDPAQDAYVKDVFCKRLQERIDENSEEGRLLSEEPVVTQEGISFTQKKDFRVEDMCQPRDGVRLDLSQPGKIGVWWSHMQADGVGLWRALRPLFDPNPQILRFDNKKKPLPLIPEMMALPSTAKSVGYRAQLGVDSKAPLKKGFHMWSTQPIKELKEELGGSFNLLSTSLLLEELFHQHPDAKKLTVGMTVAFTFLECKNQYGVHTLQVKRGSFEEIYRQVQKKVSNPATVWGNFSNQSYLLSRCPDELFMNVVNFYRGQIDVLISNLPVGKADVSIGDVPAEISVFPSSELSIPYYFLLLGTRSQIHLSYTTKVGVDRDFLDQARLLSRIESFKGKALPAVMPIKPAVQLHPHTEEAAPVHIGSPPSASLPAPSNQHSPTPSSEYYPLNPSKSL